MAFGENLACLRKGKGLSQERLAEELNLTRQTISKWELNQSTPDLEYLLKLSEFFEVSTDYLIKGEQEEFKDTFVEESINDEDKASALRLNDEDIYKWCFYVGTVLSAISLLGIIIFVICSAFNPWDVWIDDRHYTGISAFLMGTETLGFFNTLCIIFLLSIAAVVFAIIKRIDKKSEEKR